jgi:diguanylate cyclase (GGDEF)-like protein
MGIRGLSSGRWQLTGEKDANCVPKGYTAEKLKIRLDFLPFSFTPLVVGTSGPFQKGAQILTLWQVGSANIAPRGVAMLIEQNGRSWVLELASGDENAKTLPLKIGESTIGRSSTNFITIDEDIVSRKHCEFFLDAKSGTVTLRDLGSRNGTFVNGKRLMEVQTLSDGDRIQMGKSQMNLRSEFGASGAEMDKSGAHTRELTMREQVELLDSHALLLNETAQTLNKSIDLETAIAEVTQLVRKELKADQCSIILEKHFDQIKKRGFPSAITLPVIEEGLIVLVRDASTYPNLGKTAVLQGLKSAICVPIEVENVIVGVLYAAKIQPNSSFFTDKESQLAIGISHQLALAIQRMEMKRELKRSVFRDSLTGLPNQVLFTDLLHQAAKRKAKDAKFDFAVITLDLDNFKEINDVYGTAFGDQLLIDVAKRLEDNLRAGDGIARMSGASFAFLSQGIGDDQEAHLIANHLQEILAEPFELLSSGVLLTCGIGIRLSSLEFEKPIDLRRDAETAMFRAKEMGRSQYQVFSKSMHDRSVARHQMESKLRRGIENQEFRIKFHPIVELSSGQVGGFEALARWQQPADVLLAAKDFIPVAEKTQLIFAIDMMVMKIACENLKKWRSEFRQNPNMFVSTNLSGRQLSRPGIVQDVADCVEKSGIEAKFLQLEFSEKILMENREEAISVLSDLRDLGVRISIDDFGTGYSSLNYLRLFPIDSLKIDRSFVSGEDWKTAKLVSDLGSAMDLKVFAEGVENPGQLENVRTMNCDYAQGNYFSEVIESKAVVELLQQKPIW